MNSLRTIFRAPAARNIVRRQPFIRSPAPLTHVRNASTPSNGAKPKILDEKAPSKEEESQETREHNKDMENRAEKAHDSVGKDASEKDGKSQKVDKEFWKGGEPVAKDGGVDKDA